MSLADHYDAAPKRKPCTVCVWYDQLDEPDREFFDDKATGPIVALWRACHDAGLEIGETQFRRHMTECRGRGAS